MILVGSQALCSWKGEFFDFKCDFDVIAYESELKKEGLSFEGKDQIKVGEIEFINIDLLNSKELIFHYLNSTDLRVVAMPFRGEKINLWVAPPPMLYIMKRSHMHRPLKFARHMAQLQELISLGADQLDEEGQRILKERIKLTKQKFGDRVPSLNQSNEDFFDDQVTKYFVHDDLHKVVAYEDEPMYEKMKRDKSLAKCEKDLWDQFSPAQKMNCVREECYVIALERFIIPKLMSNESHMPAHFAFDKALEKVCTTLTSGWFRDFAIDHWAALRADQKDFLGEFRLALLQETLQLKKEYREHYSRIG